MHWYLLPLDYAGNIRGPRYLKWRGNPQGINVAWSLMDFGAIDLAVVAADTNEAQHQELAAYTDCYAIGEELASEALALLQVYGIETNALEDASVVEQRHRLLALAQTYQAIQIQEAQPGAMARMAAPVDVSGLVSSWAGQSIHFGIAGEITDGTASN